jgi:hypothetical protein
MFAFFIFIMVVFIFMNQIKHKDRKIREQNKRIEKDQKLYTDLVEKCKMYNERYIDMYDNSYKVFMA